MDVNNLTLSPGGWLVWIIVGLVAGFLASHFVKGGGYGLLGDLIVGLLGTIVVAFIGAVILLFVVRRVTGGRLRRA